MSQTNSRLRLQLDQEEKEALRELLSEQGCSILLKAIGQLVQFRGADVLTIADPTRLVKAKNEYDGALALFNEIKKLKEQMK